MFYANRAAATYFAATREEMIQGEESLEDGTTQLSSGGYLATLAVYHELHCLVSFSIRTVMTSS